MVQVAQDLQMDNMTDVNIRMCIHLLVVHTAKCLYACKIHIFKHAAKVLLANVPSGHSNYDQIAVCLLPRPFEREHISLT